MSRGTVLRAADRQVQTWKNGSGVTREIASGGLSSDGTFDWRVSMAEVTVPGPFSKFDGVDRILCVLAGTLLLEVEGRSPVTLDPASEPYSFPGDAPAQGAPMGGGVLDLNVMTRRSGWHAEVARLSGDALIEAAEIILLLATGKAWVDGEALEEFDAYLAQDREGRLPFTSAAPTFVVRIGSTVPEDL